MTRLDKHVTLTPCLKTGSHEWGQKKATKCKREKSAEGNDFRKYSMKD
jgi:hypothetical protein